MATGNPINEKLQPYHDVTEHQASGSDLLRYCLGLDISTATMGVDSIAQLEENVKTAIEMEPFSQAERVELETMMA